MSKLFIAEEDAIGVLLFALLTEEGYQVTPTNNRAEALEILPREGARDLARPTGGQDR